MGLAHFLHDFGRLLVPFLLVNLVLLLLLLLRLLGFGLCLPVLDVRPRSILLSGLFQPLQIVLLAALRFQLPRLQLFLEILFLHLLETRHGLLDVILRELLLVLHLLFLDVLGQPLHQLRLLAFRLKLALLELVPQLGRLHIRKLKGSLLKPLLGFCLRLLLLLDLRRLGFVNGFVKVNVCFFDPLDQDCLGAFGVELVIR